MGVKAINLKRLCISDVIEFLKYLNRRETKIENFDPRKLVVRVEPEIIEFSDEALKEPFSKLIDALIERDLIELNSNAK
jgi:hypothetical protein